MHLDVSSHKDIPSVPPSSPKDSLSAVLQLMGAIFCPESGQQAASPAASAATQAQKPPARAAQPAAKAAGVHLCFHRTQTSQANIANTCCGTHLKGWAYIGTYHLVLAFCAEVVTHVGRGKPPPNTSSPESSRQVLLERAAQSDIPTALLEVAPLMHSVALSHRPSSLCGVLVMYSDG